MKTDPFPMLRSAICSFAAGVVLLSPLSGADGNEVVQRVVAHASAHPGGDAPASFGRSSYRVEAEELKHLPIGVFDSGIGGLTVLEALLTVDAFHNETLQPG